MSHKSVAQESTRVSCKSVPQECPTRVSSKSESVPQSDESVARECPTRTFYKSVSYESVKNVWALVFEYVFAFGFVGSILFWLSSIHSFVYLFSFSHRSHVDSDSDSTMSEPKMEDPPTRHSFICSQWFMYCKLAWPEAALLGGSIFMIHKVGRRNASVSLTTRKITRKVHKLSDHECPVLMKHSL